jgi:hypothetical protein
VTAVHIFFFANCRFISKERNEESRKKYIAKVFIDVGCCCCCCCCCCSGQVKDGFLFRRRFLDESVVLEDVHLAHGASPLLQQPLVDAALVELE